ncbi:MAG: NAD(P)/FAD-dependent oxidoreductase [Steroidobacteraceae bacterium]
MTLEERNLTNYYQASAPGWAPRPALAGEQSCDVVVVGAGLAGCSAALELAQRGLSVALLEARQVGFGASGRSGAQLIAGYACGQDRIEALVGKETARALWDISLEGLDLVRQRVAQHDIDCDLSWGHLLVALKDRQRRELEEEYHKLSSEYGYTSLRLLDQATVRGKVASERYVAGLLDERSGHCHPLKYVQGLAAAGEAAGVKLFEGSPVVKLSRGREVILETPTGRLRSRFAVLAGNCYLGGLVPELRRKIMAVGTYIVATEPLGAARAAALLGDNLAVSDINFVLDYFRLSADHRLLFGGRVSYSGLDPLGTSRATRARMLKVFPQLRDVAVEYAWGGYVDITVNRAPHFGRLDDNLYFLQGFSGHGMALTGIAGRLAAEAIAGQAERFDLYAKIRHLDFPGGLALRRPALVLAMLWYRLRDFL